MVVHAPWRLVARAHQRPRLLSKVQHALASGQLARGHHLSPLITSNTPTTCFCPPHTKKPQVILPLYPQYSISTSGSSLRLVEALMRRDPDLAQLEATVIPSWCAPAA